MSKVYSVPQLNKATPQNEPIAGTEQIRNSAGGYVWGVDSFKRLHRFLILGSEGGTYYIGERELTLENAQAVVECLKLNYKQTIDHIVRVSEGGLAPKNDPAVFALAIAASVGADKKPDTTYLTRAYALDQLARVCRIATDLFMFCEMVFKMRGRGRGIRTALANWYQTKKPDALALQVVKYQNRNNWRHADTLMLAHPKPETHEHQAIYGWATGRVQYTKQGLPMRQKWDAEKKLWVDDDYETHMPSVIDAFEHAKLITNSKDMATYVAKKKLQREMIPSQFLSDPLVQEAMLPNLGLTALIRNLANFGKSGMLSSRSFEMIGYISDRLTNTEELHRSLVHPVKLLIALNQYRAGTAWEAVPQIIDALNAAFHLAFHNVPATNKIFYLGIDVSGSMTWDASRLKFAGNMQARTGAAALAMVTARTEPKYIVKGFCGELVPIPITAKSSLSEVESVMSGLRAGSTDCALPMIDATLNRIPVDCFIIYTDNETWVGKIHPVQALRQYRNVMQKDAKLIVVGMASNGFSIADPTDLGMLDCVGFDSSLPQVIAQFVV